MINDSADPDDKEDDTTIDLLENMTSLLARLSSISAIDLQTAQVIYQTLDHLT